MRVSPWGQVARNSVFGVCDQVRLKLKSSATETNESIMNLAFCNFRYDFQRAKNKCADETVPVRRLVFVIVDRMQQNQTISWRGLNDVDILKEPSH